MAKSAMQTVALVGAVLFGLWYITGQGCKGDSKAFGGGIMGEGGSLCFNWKELQATLGGGGQEDEPDEAKLQQNIKNMREKPVNLKSRFGPGVNPYASEYAYSYPAGFGYTQPPYGKAYGFRDTHPAGYMQHAWGARGVQNPNRANMALSYHVENAVTIA